MTPPSSRNSFSMSTTRTAVCEGSNLSSRVTRFSENESSMWSPPFGGRTGSPKAVLPLGLLFLQPPDPGVRPPSVRNREGYHDLVRGRGVRDVDLHRVEVSSHERSVLVVERNVDRHPGRSALLGRWDDGVAATDGISHGCPELGVQKRGDVFELTRGSDDPGLPVAFGRGSPECLDRSLREQGPQLFAVVDELCQVFLELTRERVLEDRGHSHLPDWPWDLTAPFLQGLLDHRDQLADLHGNLTSSLPGAHVRSHAASQARTPRCRTSRSASLSCSTPPSKTI